MPGFEDPKGRFFGPWWKNARDGGMGLASEDCAVFFHSGAVGSIFPVGPLAHKFRLVGCVFTHKSGGAHLDFGDGPHYNLGSGTPGLTLPGRLPFVP